MIAIVVFLCIIIILVSGLLYAKKKLTSQGEVILTVNDRELKVNLGDSILKTLSDNGIFLPSACGGGGTCGLCKCQVLEGGGSILPTETGFFTRKEQNNYWRLGCQVKIRQNMKIKVPDDILGIQKFEATVVSNKNVATFIKELVLQLPESVDFNFKPGGYIQLDVPTVIVDYGRDIFVEEQFRDEWSAYGMWELVMRNEEPTYRAYSMANYPAEKKIIKLNIRIATPPWDASKKQFMKVNPGICSSYVFSLKKGDKVSLSGPYGEFHIKDTQREMLYIGGGAGMAPLRSHIFHLFKTLQTKRKVSYWYGARSKREIFYEQEFKEIEKSFKNFTFNIALSEPKPEDQWIGYTGFIHQVVLDNYLKHHPEPEEIEYYLCGPPMMNDAVLSMLHDMGVPEEMIAFDDFGG